MIENRVKPLKELYMKKLLAILIFPLFIFIVKTDAGALCVSVAKANLRSGPSTKYEKVWERIGRLKQRHPAVNRYYTIDVQQKDGLATKVTWRRKTSKQNKDAGVYFIRTNIEKPDESTIWNIYNTIREIEATFRILKTDLSMRPVIIKKMKTLKLIYSWQLLLT